MHNPKLTAVQKQSAVQRYLGGDTAEAMPDTAVQIEEELKRISYCILRGRHQMLPALRLISQKGQVRSFDYSSLTGVNLNKPDELILHFEGRECYSLIISGLELNKELLECLTTSVWYGSKNWMNWLPRTFGNRTRSSLS